jgi:hypothetical protein
MSADTELRIRLARDDDAAALARLAALDSARPLTGEVLVAELDGELVAALAARSGRTVADPFRPTAALVRALAEVALARGAGAAAARRRRGARGRARTSWRPRVAA